MSKPGLMSRLLLTAAAFGLVSVLTQNPVKITRTQFKIKSSKPTPNPYAWENWSKKIDPSRLVPIKQPDGTVIYDFLFVGSPKGERKPTCYVFDPSTVKPVYDADGNLLFPLYTKPQKICR